VGHTHLSQSYINNRHAILLYVRFTLSYRDTEHLFTERDIDNSYEIEGTGFSIFAHLPPIYDLSEHFSFSLHAMKVSKLTKILWIIAE